MSDKSVAERLQTKGDRRLAVLNGLEPVDEAIGLRHARASVETAEVVVLFVRNRADLERTLLPTLALLKADAIFWLAYPKLTSPNAGDLHRDIIHTLAPVHGLNTTSQIAIDSDRSALRLKREVKDTPV